MIKRKIIHIDETLCDGCALCIPSCPEGALQIIDGKAKLVKESFCDGLGACLGDCPRGALNIVETYADEYDEDGVIEHIKATSPDKLQSHIEHLQKHKSEIPTKHTGGCPSAKVLQFELNQPVNNQIRLNTQLRQWPIQLHLVPPTAPYFKNADFALVADCVPFAYPNFHNDILSGNAIAIGCPKLDDTHAYVEKLTQIFQYSNPKTIKVVIMEVPCCSGLVQITKKALAQAELNVEIEVIVIGIKGDIITKQFISNSFVNF